MGEEAEEGLGTVLGDLQNDEERLQQKSLETGDRPAGSMDMDLKNK